MSVFFILGGIKFNKLFIFFISEGCRLHLLIVNLFFNISKFLNAQIAVDDQTFLR